MARVKYDYGRSGEIAKASLVTVKAIGFMDVGPDKYVRLDIQHNNHVFPLAMTLEDLAFIEEAIAQMRIEFPGVIPS